MNFFTIIHWKRNGNEIQALIFWYKLSMIRSLVLEGRISKSGILRSEVSRYTQGVSTITILIKLFSEIFLVFWKPILSNLFTLINNRPHSKKCIFIFNWNFYTSRYIIYLLTFCFFFGIKSLTGTTRWGNLAKRIPILAESLRILFYWTSVGKLSFWTSKYQLLIKGYFLLRWYFL